MKLILAWRYLQKNLWLNLHSKCLQQKHEMERDCCIYNHVRQLQSKNRRHGSWNKPNFINWYLHGTYANFMGCMLAAQTPHAIRLATKLTFIPGGYIKSENKRLWSSENRKLIHKVTIHDVKVELWVPTRSNGPILFSENLSSDCYTHSDTILCRPVRLQENLCHFFSKILQQLKCKFAVLIRQKCWRHSHKRSLWPPRSPGLNPWFSLARHVKG
jgi:hypothetical protein